MNEKIRKVLEKQHYKLFGNSAVQICNWTKKSLLDKGVCYKEKFYGIKSHRCCQMTPFFYCENECLHCWRPIKLTKGMKIEKIENPLKIIEESIKNQRKLLSGFKGNKKVNMQKWKEAQNPNQFAISLIGEPTLYPKLAELILELKKRKITGFLVTNGLNPERLLELKNKKALPTQLYISLNSSNKKDYEKWHKSNKKNAWKLFNKSLLIMAKLPTRKVIRLTLVRNENMKESDILGYAKLIKKASPNFLEIKAFMSIGYSRKIFGYEKMPSFEEIKSFAKKLLAFLQESTK